VVAHVGALHGCEVGVALPLEDDHGWVAEPDQDEVQQQAARASVSVEEWVNLLERVVQASQLLRKGLITVALLKAIAGPADVVDPLVDLLRHKRPGGWC